MKKTLTLSVAVLTSVSFSFAQEWIKKIDEKNPNFYEIQKAFYKENKNVTPNREEESKRILGIFKRKKEKVKLEKGEEGETKFSQFKRWEYFMKNRIMPDGTFPDPSIAYNEYEKMQTSQSSSKSMMVGNGNWTILGPQANITTGGNMGRLNCVTFLPGNSNVVFVGAASGGMWRSNDAGATWATTTDKLGSIGISDIAIDPSNTNTIYIATGDCNSAGSITQNCYSIGVMKSTDGGVTWKQSGLQYAQSQARYINRLLINPTNPNILFAATSTAIFKTTDGGNMWYSVFSGNVRDMEFKADDPNTIFAVTTGFYKSTNGGASFSPTSTGLPASSGVRRMSMAVTAADANYIYILVANTDGSTNGVYRSTNGGTTFAARNTTTDIFGSNNQGWYDITVDVAPTNRDIVYVGGVYTYKSTNGGTTLNGVYSTHADIHNIKFIPGSSTTLWIACDGGIFRTLDGAASMSDRSKGLGTNQPYKIGTSQLSSKLMAGLQDNGTILYSGSGWTEVGGADGMDCFIDWSNDNVMYSSIYNGDLYRSTNGGGAFSGINTGITETTQWLTVWQQSPQRANTLYAGFQSIWYSTNRGTNWSKLPFSPSGSDCEAICVAPSDTNYIYVSKGSTLYRTTNHGATAWVTKSPASAGGNITGITVSNTNPLKLWVTISGFVSGKKVWASADGGDTWTNYSDGLPNMPANCIVYQNGSSNDAVYVGTDIGVFYRDNALSQWVSFNNGLPNVIIFDLDINYFSSKLRAGTWGRSMWETDLYTVASVKPTAQFSSNYLEICPAGSIEYFDKTSQSPTSWEWTFSGGVPSTSTLQNPIVSYATPGLYDVKLKTTNAFGSDSITTTSYMNVKTPPTISAGNDVAICSGQSVQLTATGGTSYSWTPSTGLDDRYLSNPTFSGTSTRTYTVTGASNTVCTSTDAIQVVVYTVAPAISSITQGGNILTCSLAGTGITYQWYLNGGLISGANSVTYDASATGDGDYTVMVTNPCGSTLSNLLTVTGVGINVNNLDNYVTISPNPNNGVFTINIKSIAKENYTLSITNVLGQLVYTESLSNNSAEYIKQFDLAKNGKGVYFIGLKNNTNQLQKKIVVQ